VALFQIPTSIHKLKNIFAVLPDFESRFKFRTDIPPPEQYRDTPKSYPSKASRGTVRRAGPSRDAPPPPGPSRDAPLPPPPPSRDAPPAPPPPSRGAPPPPPPARR